MLSLPLLDPAASGASESRRRLPDWLKRDLPRGNENFFCHREALAGTKFLSRVCQTSEQIRISRQASRDATDRALKKGLQSGNAGP